jgi:dihydrofolate synthase/folylpolyglutamate synthase
MTYEETISKIDTYHRFSREPGLACMTELLSRLGNPQSGLNCIHVAGTNGKGTTCTLVASVLMAAGYRTGLYLSPHVCDFRERIQLCGKMIPRAELVSAAGRVFAQADAMQAEGKQLTEFELITAVALLWFSEQHCDAVVLEVGLGGRFDATNVIEHPLVSAIASISLDHTEILGDTLGKIAGEKCGILKPGCPAVCSPGEPLEALEVIRRTARERGCPLTEASLSQVKVVRCDLSGTELQYNGQTLLLPFLGAHQVSNAALTLAILEILRGEGWTVSPEAFRQGFASACLPARLEVLSVEPPILLDGAHNPGGTAALADAIRRYLPGRTITAVMGMMADKDTVSAAENLRGLFSRVIAVAPPSPRAMDAKSFADLWRRAGTDAEPAESTEKALQLAFSGLRPDKALVVCGSLYLAGEARSLLLQRISALHWAEKNKKK